MSIKKVFVGHIDEEDVETYVKEELSKMRTFKVVSQAGMSNANRQSDKLVENIIKCDDISFNNNEISGNLDSVSFIVDGNETETVNLMMGDPYYKLYESINDDWVLIDKHNCK